MATNVTSFGTESTIPNRWVRTHDGRFAMIAVANLRRAWALFLNPPASSLSTDLAAPVCRHPAEPLKSSRRSNIRLSPQGVV